MVEENKPKLKRKHDWTWKIDFYTNIHVEGHRDQAQHCKHGERTHIYVYTALDHPWKAKKMTIGHQGHLMGELVASWAKIWLAQQVTCLREECQF